MMLLLSIDILHNEVTSTQELSLSKTSAAESYVSIEAIPSLPVMQRVQFLQPLSE